MNRSLTVRIFLLHITWTVLFTGGVGWWLVAELGDRYDLATEQWRRDIESIPVEQFVQPLALQVARRMLIETDGDALEEVREKTRTQISEGVGRVIERIESVEDVIVVDDELRILYSAADQKWIDLTYREPWQRELFASTHPVRFPREDGDQNKTWYVLPVFADAENATNGVPERLGSVVVVYHGNPDLWSDHPVELPNAMPEKLTQTVIVATAVIALGGLLIAALSVAPVRRLERAVADFRERDFRGGIDAGRMGATGELAGAVQALNELGGRIEALDRQAGEREQLLATLSLALEDGMIAFSTDGAPKNWNRAALRILGASEGGARPGPQPADPVEVIERALDRNPTLLRLPLGGERRSHETHLRLQDGTEAPAKISCLRFESGGGEAGRLLLIRDLAALRRVEAHLLESSRYAVLAHIAAGLAHEIRNPLHSIGLNASVVEQYVDRENDDRTREAMSESLRSIQDETRRLSSLLNNYLGMVRPEQTTQMVDLRELCRRVVALVLYTASQQKVRLTFAGDDDVPLVRGTADRLQQAILNLVLNSLQALPEGGEVTVETVAAGGTVEVRVSDDGPGVPSEIRGQLFTIRMTTKPGGTGLGLPLVRLIAESHGGSIRYDDRPDGGASFTLSLPIRDAA